MGGRGMGEFGGSDNKADRSYGGVARFERKVEHEIAGEDLWEGLCARRRPAVIGLESILGSKAAGPHASVNPESCSSKNASTPSIT